MKHTAPRTALCAISGIPTVRVPRGGWHRDDPGGPNGDNGGGHHGRPGADDPGGDDDGQDSGGKKPEIKGDVDPDRVARSLAAARDGERKAKDRAKTAEERLTAVLKAAGLAPDGKADPEEQIKALQSRAEQAEQRVHQLATRDAVRAAAATHKADAEALLDSQRFMTKLQGLDPEADDFGGKVAELVKAAVKDTPRYAATSMQGSQGPAPRSVDHTGGNGGRQRANGLGAAISAAYGR